MSLTPEVEEEYQKAFALFDKDSDGKLTKAEFLKIIESVGLENWKKRGEEMMSEVGATEHLVYDPFKQAFINRMKIPFKKKDLMDAFEVFDTEKSGKILDLELKQIFLQMNSNLEEAEIQRMIKEMDPDPKGMLNYRVLVDKIFAECLEG